MAEDDPELWEALHRLTCVMHQMHDHDMLRTDSILDKLKNMGRYAIDKLNGTKQAPDTYIAGTSTVKGQKETIAALEKDEQQHEASLKSHQASMEAEIAGVRAKHEPTIAADRLAIENDKRQETTAHSAIDAANKAYTLELKAKDAQSKADLAASAVKTPP